MYQDTHIYIYMYIYMYVYLYICIYIYIHIHEYMYVCTRIFVFFLSECLSLERDCCTFLVCVRVRVCARACVRACVYASWHVCMYMYIYIYYKGVWTCTDMYIKVCKYTRFTIWNAMVGVYTYKCVHMHIYIQVCTYARFFYILKRRRCQMRNMGWLRLVGSMKL